MTNLSSLKEHVATAIDAVTSDDVLDRAYAWLCERRHEAPFWHDVWHLRWRWADLKPTLRRQLLDGSYRLGTTRTVRTDDGAVEAWSARDAIVLKAVAMVLGRRLGGRVVERCCGWAGAGGAKRAVREVEAGCPDHGFVFRSDVRSRFSLAFLKPDVVCGAVRRHVRDWIRVAENAMERCVERVNLLYEQGADEVRIGEYVRRWSGWVRGGLGFDVRGVGSVLRIFDRAG